MLLILVPVTLIEGWRRSPGPKGHDIDKPLFPDLIKGAANAGAMIWVLALLAFLAAGPDRSSDQAAAFVLLAVATVFLVLFVLPSLIINYLRRR